MATIQDYLKNILSSVYGKDVRQSIHDAIQQCYYDGKAGSIDLTSREEIAVERARIDTLLAASGDTYQNTYTFTPSGLGDDATGTIISNGIVAVITLENLDFTIGTGDGTKSITTLPDGYTPIEVGLLHTLYGKDDSLDWEIGSVAVSESETTYRIQVTKPITSDFSTTSGSETTNAETTDSETDTEIGTVTVKGIRRFVYALKNVDIPELTDLRIGVDGTIYDSAGAAVRGQLSKFSDIIDSSLSIGTTTNYSFVAGGISSNGTVNDTATKRIRSENYIFARKGSTISVKLGITATFNVAAYSNTETSALLSYRGMSSDTYIVEQDCYVRFGFTVSDTSDPNAVAATTIDMRIIKDTIPSLRDEIDILKTANGLTITDFVGEEYDYDGEFIDPYVINKVEKLYQLWDALVADYPDFVSMETLGQDASGSYDIRCYTIKSYTDNPKYAVVPRDNLKILWVGGMHGSENHMLFAAYVFFKDLLENYDTKDSLRMLWNNCEFKVIPVLNPWGVDNNVRYNSNSVDLNRNFNASWVSDTTEYDNSGTEPESESETKIAVDFIKANSDAFLVINAHNGDEVTTERGIGYTASNFHSDNVYSNIVGRKIDTAIKKKYPFICAEVPAWRQKCLWYNLQSSNSGTMDKWFNYALGMHGFLMELCPSMSDDFTSYTNEIVQKMNTICIGIVLSTFVKQNKDILSDNTQIKTYSVIDT